MHHSSTQDYPDTGCARIGLRDELRLFVSCAADHEHDDILWFLAVVGTAFDEGVGLLAKTAFDEVVECLFHAWRMLRVYILHAF